MHNLTTAVCIKHVHIFTSAYTSTQLLLPRYHRCNLDNGYLHLSLHSEHLAIHTSAYICFVHLRLTPTFVSSRLASPAFTSLCLVSPAYASFRLLFFALFLPRFACFRFVSPAFASFHLVMPRFCPLSPHFACFRLISPASPCRAYFWLGTSTFGSLGPLTLHVPLSWEV